jgi:hypothetical protein
MISRLSLFVGATALAAAISLGATGAGALTMQECSAKYKAAQSAGTLNGKTWNQFRKDECGSPAAAAPAKSPPEKAAAPAPRGISNGRIAHVLQGICWESADAHLS